MADLPFGIVLIRARDNQLATLLPLAQDMLSALKEVRQGQVVSVGID
ncbi:MAG TPA: hypothetical protein VNV25_05765 [Gemmatimonadaceae bacterium]|nr:hypothetical protein [Gemmatimonadaceae bacterium]